jgi:hypothetical protein
MRRKRNITRKRRTHSRKNKKRLRGGDSPLKVAILFSGRIKGYVKDNLKRIKDKYNPIVFCSLNKSKKTDYVKEFCEFMDISDDRLNIEIPPKAPDFFSDPRMKIHKYLKTQWGDAKPESRIDNLYSQLYNNQKVYSLVESYQEKNKMKFDIVLYYRADIETKEELILPNSVKDNTVYLPEVNGAAGGCNDEGCWCDYGGLCYQVLFGNPDTMKKALSLIDSVKHICIDQQELVYVERIFKKHVENNNILIERFPYFFSLTPERHRPNNAANEM